MDQSQYLGYLWGLIPTIVLIYNMVKASINEAKNSGNVDAEQNIEITKLNGDITRISNNLLAVEMALRRDIEALGQRVNGMDTKTADELTKLDTKMEKKFDQLTELIMKLMKQN